MTTIVIMPGGFHPFHAGHLALYQSAQRAFPDAEVYVAATNDTSARPFPFPVKEKLAKLAGVEPGHFVQVKSPFRAEEITAGFDPARDQLIFVRSQKDSTKPPQPGGTKKDGSPAYLQPLLGAKRLEPFGKHAYMAYLPTVEFGPGMTSATEIRSAWPQLNEKRKTALVMSLYPRTQGNAKLAATVVKLLDAAIGTEQGVAEARVEINQDAPDNLYDIQDNLAMSRWKSSVKNVITSLFAKRYPGVQLFFKNTQDGNLFVTTDKSALASEDVGLYSNTDEFGASIIGPTAEYGVDDILYVGIGFDSIKSGKYKGIVGEMLKTIVPPLAAKFKAKPAIVIVVEDQSAGAWEAMANKLGWAFISGEDEQGVAEGLSKRDQQDVAAIKAAIERLQAQLSHPNADRDAIQQSIAHEKKRLALYGQGVAEGAPIVVIPRADRLKKPEPTKVRYQGDIVPDTKPPSTEKRGVKGRPGQRPMPKYDEDVSRRGFLRGLGAAALAGAAGSAMAQTMPNINAQQVELANKYYNALVQRAKEDGRELDTRALNFLRAKAHEAAAQKFQQTTSSQAKPQQGFSTQGSERRVAKDAGQFESHSMTEAAKKCPPATQDIALNLQNRQKAIDEYGYGPLNPDLPNTKFWMKKVDEWNLDSMEEAQQSLCGNCAAFDVRQDTLDCIAQGIDSDSPDDAEGVIDAGELGYCKFLKFKCASRRTCDAWVTGGPLVDKPVDENQGWAATLESDQVDVATDPELVHARRFARQHYPEFSGDEDLAFAKWVQRGLGHSEKNDREHDRKLKQLTNKVAMLQAALQQQAKNSDYLEEKWSAEYKSSIDCNNPRGFSQKAHCAGRKK